jgi:hypothetical protein
LCLVWGRREFLERLIDYGYYRLNFIFDRNLAKRSKNQKEGQEGFNAYCKIDDLNKCILRTVPMAFDFPDSLVIAIRRFSEIIWLNHEELRNGHEECQLCDSKAYAVLRLQGRTYDANTLEFLPPEKQHNSPEEFRLCHLHSMVASICYNLAHMNWNFHWNCHYRVQAVLNKHPTYTAEQIINDINPEIFKRLAYVYIQFYAQLNAYGETPEKAEQRSFRDGTTKRKCRAWKKILKDWKRRMTESAE